MPSPIPAAGGGAVAPTGPLPAGVYHVSEQVVFDTCRTSRALPAQVTLLKRHDERGANISVPLPSFGIGTGPTKRVQTSVHGYQGGGMAHPKVCPGAQQTFKERMYDITANGFRISVDYEVADGWDCPNPRPAPICQTRVVYSYSLATAACDAQCDGTVPNLADRDVPAGPTALTCSCSRS